MAFPQPNAQRELANRKILEELQLKKQMLLKQGAVAPLTATTISLNQPSPVNSLPMCSIPPVSATAREEGEMSACMKLKTLEGHLQDLSGFSAPKLQLEQYETPAHIAAVALYTMQTQFGALEERLVLDAGCGPGMLSLGAAMLGAGHVTAVDIDHEVLEVFRQNVEDMEIESVDAVQCDFLGPGVGRWENYFDTVLMNPPFGTKNNAGIDMKFLKMGLDLSCDSVYSLHKSATRTHIQKKIKEWGVEGSVVAELRYNLQATYKFHRQQTRDIAVDLWRVHHAA